MTTPQEDIAMRPTADVHVPTQQEDEQQEFDDAFECVCLREAVSHAVAVLGREEAGAIIEYELQKNKRMN